MAIILFFTILGFAIGLVYIIRTRKISPSGILITMFKGLLSDKLRDFLRNQYKRNNYQ